MYLSQNGKTLVEMNLALAQINTKLGDVESNLEKHLALTKDARHNGADLILFPELSLTGYTLYDLVPSVALCPNSGTPAFRHLLQASRDIDMVIGFVNEDARHRFYIAAAYLSKGEIIHIHNKVYLPSYGIFDEKRFIAPGRGFRSFETRWGRVGMLVCEDFWHASSPYLLWLDGADILLMTSASPGRGVTDEQLGSAKWVETINQTYAGLFTCFVAHTNRVGFEDGFNFWGGSTVFDPDGKLVAKAPEDVEVLTYASLDLAQLRRTRSRLPLLRDERPELVLHELERVLKNDRN
jgi:NAD+ synthase (glutamine-hydrolysing)